MSVAKTKSAATPQLRRNSLGLGELVFQGITHIAPAGSIIFTFPIIAHQAGPDMPLSLLLSTMVCFFIGNTVAQFSNYMPSSGGYYSFATRGLGSRTGFMATWNYLIHDNTGGALLAWGWLPHRVRARTGAHFFSLPSVFNAARHSRPHAPIRRFPPEIAVSVQVLTRFKIRFLCISNEGITELL